MKTKRIEVSSILSIVLAILISINCYIIQTYANSIQTANNKISNELKAIMQSSDDNELIPISVWLDLIDLTLVETTLQDKFAIQSIDYTDEKLFEENVINELRTTETILPTDKSFSQISTNSTVDVIRSTYGIDTAMTNDEISRCVNEKMSMVEIVKVGKQHEYIKKWRNSVQSVQKEHNNAFLKDLENLNINYSSLFVQDTSSLITMEVVKSDINKIAGINYVDSIDHFVNAPIESYLAVGSYSIQQKMNILPAQNSFFNSNSYGSGIKIGIIDNCDISTNLNDEINPQFLHASSSLGSRIIQVYNSTSTTGNSSYEGAYHGATVLAVAAGDAVTISGITYRGVAPQASVYFTLCYNANTARTGIEKLINNGVNVINMSVGTPNQTYNEYTQYIDEQIRNSKVTFCVATGNYSKYNSHEIYSDQAYAYNAITVGVASHVANNNSKYPISNESQYLQSNNTFATNKPDIVAMGDALMAYYSDAGTVSNSIMHIAECTSLSTPFVTGVVALMMQKQATLISKPANVKAILLAAANPNLIDGDQLRDDANLLYNKSGAGLVDAYAAISIITNSNFVSYYGTPSSANYDNVSLASVYLNAGDTIRVAGTFLKTTNDDIAVETTPYGTDLDFMLKESSSGSIVAAAASDRDNVEIFEFTAVASGYYTIQYAIWSLHTTPYTLHCSAAWTID